MQKTSRGFTYLPVTQDDCFSWGGFAICDHCNTPFEHGYLVFILNSAVCPNCMTDWLERQDHYSDEDIREDLAFQEAYQDEWYAYHINKMKGGD